MWRTELDEFWIWDRDKNDSNKRKHGIDFETAIQVFEDPFTKTVEDPHFDEHRLRTLGMIDNTLVMVVHTLPRFDPAIGGQVARIVTARRATRHERRTYEEGPR